MENQNQTSQNKIEIGKDFINLEKLIASKNPKLLRIIPRFIISYIKRIIHQDEINAALYRYRDLSGIEFVNKILFDEFKINITVLGEHNIPQNGRFILASNHPLGGLDGLSLLSIVAKKHKDIVFPVNDLLMNLPQMRELFIPINKHGSNIQNFKIFEQTYTSDKSILYFPAGLCSRKQKGQIADLEWKKSFISQAKKYQRDILPTYVSGKNTKRFYRIANIRKFFKIKANIEMLYLVDEMYKQHKNPFQIIIGKPIPWQTFDQRYSEKQWAAKLKKYVYQLANNNELLFVPEEL